jgi:hypothetical protein
MAEPADGRSAAKVTCRHAVARGRPVRAPAVHSTTRPGYWPRPRQESSHWRAARRVLCRHTLAPSRVCPGGCPNAVQEPSFRSQPPTNVPIKTGLKSMISGPFCDSLDVPDSLSKPPPSASRPPHRAPASIRDQDTYTETLDSEAVKATPVQTVAFDVKCNHKGFVSSPC